MVCTNVASFRYLTLHLSNGQYAKFTQTITPASISVQFSVMCQHLTLAEKYYCITVLKLIVVITTPAILKKKSVTPRSLILSTLAGYNTIKFINQIGEDKQINLINA